VAFGVLGAAIAGCADPVSTASDDRTLRKPRTFSSSTAIGTEIGDVEFSIDTATDEGRLRDLSTGAEVFAELSGEDAAKWAEMITTIAESDQWYAATASLNPLENAPEGWQPEDRLPPALVERARSFSVRDLERMAQRKEEIRIPGLDTTKYRVRVANVEKVTARRSPPRAMIPSAAHPVYGFQNFLDGYPQYYECVDIAAAIASERVAYLASKNWVTSTGKNVVSGQFLQIVARFGKNFVEGPDVVQAFLAAGMSGAEAMAGGITTKLKTVWYNRAQCQGVITISHPIPPMFSWSGGGSTKSCSIVLVTYEMSHDGGLTWHTVQVEQKMCSAEE